MVQQVGSAEHSRGGGGNKKKAKQFKEQFQAREVVIQVILNGTRQNVAPPKCCANLSVPSHSGMGGTG